MFLEQGQHQILSQKMIMSQQLINALSFVNLSSEEVQEVVAKEVKRNPFLEFKTSSNTGVAGALASDKHQNFLENLEDRSSLSLQESLSKQAGESIRDDFVLEAANMIIQNLDRNGFNCVTLKDLFSKDIDEKKFTKLEIKKAIRAVRHFDPCGCACDNLKQSLIVQAGILCESEKTGQILDVYKPIYELVAKVIKDSYTSLANLNDIPAFIHSLEKKNIVIDEEIAEELINFIQDLNPYPGRNVSNESENPHKDFITPVAEIIKEANVYKVILNNDEVPAIEISSDYMSSNKTLSKAEKKELKLLVDQAKDLISHLDFRNETILKVLTAIVNVQQNFFAGRVSKYDGQRNPGYLKVLKQKDVADILGISKSTVSRAANCKYIRCEWGLVEIKKLFSNEVCNGLSQDFVIGQVHEIIKSSEEKFSDAKISEALKLQGIDISTRTVNKYRNKLRIRPSYYR